MGLKLKNLSKTWQGFQLRNIDLTVNDGEYFVVLGPTGAGKTLLLETVMGFHKPDKGEVFLDDVDVTFLPPETRGIGYVSQNCVLFPHLDVRQNVEFGLKMRGIGKQQRKRAVDGILESAGVKHLEHRRPATLSGGESQKVALARVLAINPKTIFLDEPLTAVDVEATRELKNVLKQIHRDGKTIVHVTHDQVEAFSLGERMAIMRAGEIVQTDRTREIFLQPRSEFVARFLGYENIFQARLKEKRDGYLVVDVEGVDLAVSGKFDATDCTVAIRPEDIQVHLSPVTPEGLNVVEAAVGECTDQGPYVAVSFEGALKLQASMTKSAFLEKNLETGQKVWLAFKRGAVKVIA